MSNAINDVDDKDKGKDEPLVVNDKALNDTDSKKRILLLYGGTVGGMLLIVIIAFLIAVVLGGSKSSLTAKYVLDKNNLEAKLISENYLEQISSIEVDGEKINEIKESYTFNKEGPHTVIFKFKDSLDSINEMFKDAINLEEADLSSFETSNLRNMSSMFYNCKSLKKVEFGQLSTDSVEDMSYLFYGCTLLNEVPLENFNTSNLISMKLSLSSSSK